MNPVSVVGVRLPVAAAVNNGKLVALVVFLHDLHKKEQILVEAVAVEPGDQVSDKMVLMEEMEW